MTPYLQGEKLNDSRFLIQNHGIQKEVTQHFSSAERKELSTQNSMSTKMSLNNKQEGNSLAVQWLGLSALTAGIQVQTLVNLSGN